MHTHIATIFVNYNSGDYLRQALTRLRETDPTVHVIVVDNGSSDGSLADMTDLQEAVEIIQTGENLGFAAGANVGAAHAIQGGATEIFFINPDAILLPGCLSDMSAHLQTSTVGAVAPIIYSNHRQREIWFAGGSIDFWRLRTRHHHDTRATELSTHPSPYLTGCVLGLRSAVFEEIGGFDERFFLYYEDADLSQRLVHAGYTLALVEDAAAIHDEQSNTSSPTKTYFLVLMGLLFFDKHAQGWRRAWFVFFARFRYAFSRGKYLWTALRGRDTTTQKHIIHAFTDYYARTTDRYHISHRQLR